MIPSNSTFRIDNFTFRGWTFALPCLPSFMIFAASLAEEESSSLFYCSVCVCGARLDWLCPFPPLGNSVIIWAPASVSVSAGGDNRLWFYLPLLLCTFPLNKKSRGSSADKKGKYEEHSFTFYSDSSSSSSPSSSSLSCKFFLVIGKKKKDENQTEVADLSGLKLGRHGNTHQKSFYFLRRLLGAKTKTGAPSQLYLLFFFCASQC